MATPGVHLDPMTDDEFAAYLGPSVQEYAAQCYEAGRFADESQALRAAQEAFDTLLPDGLSTKDSYLYTVRDSANGEEVGKLFVAVRTQGSTSEAFIYDIIVDEAQRGRGYGRAIMLACAARARELGVASVRLHVFAHNTIARSLYTSLGFVETDLLMALSLEDADSAR